MSDLKKSNNTNIYIYIYNLITNNTNCGIVSQVYGGSARVVFRDRPERSGPEGSPFRSLSRVARCKGIRQDGH